MVGGGRSRGGRWAEGIVTWVCVGLSGLCLVLGTTCLGEALLEGGGNAGWLGQLGWAPLVLLGALGTLPAVTVARYRQAARRLSGASHAVVSSSNKDDGLASYVRAVSFSADAERPHH